MLDGAKKHFGFGYMRLPMNGDEVDIEQTDGRLFSGEWV